MERCLWRCSRGAAVCCWGVGAPPRRAAPALGAEGRWVGLWADGRLWEAPGKCGCSVAGLEPLTRCIRPSRGADVAGNLLGRALARLCWKRDSLMLSVQFHQRTDCLNQIPLKPHTTAMRAAVQMPMTYRRLPNYCVLSESSYFRADLLRQNNSYGAAAVMPRLCFRSAAGANGSLACLIQGGQKVAHMHSYRPSSSLMHTRVHSQVV